jgi:hypothetical protein
MNPDYTNALVGGLIIGLATALMMHLNGRVTGISGIISGSFKFVPQDWYRPFRSSMSVFKARISSGLQDPPSGNRRGSQKNWSILL